MGIRWKTFEMPKRLEADKNTLTATYAKFTAEPFERGYGTTIGNADLLDRRRRGHEYQD